MHHFAGQHAPFARSMCTIPAGVFILSVSRSKSYQIIRELNKELKSMGYHTIAGKCPIQFFKQKFYGLEIGGESA